MERVHIFSFLGLCILGIATIANFVIQKRSFQLDEKPSSRRLVAQSEEKAGDFIMYNCLEPGDLTELVTVFPQFFAVASSASGSSSLRDFASSCASEIDGIEPFWMPDAQEAMLPGSPDMPREQIHDFFKELSLTTSFQAPPVLGGQVNNERSVMEVFETASASTLLFYSHRAEVSRLYAAIEKVVGYSLVAPMLTQNHARESWSLDFQRRHNFQLTRTEKGYVLPEDALIELIAEKPFEIYSSDTHLLTCSVYRSILRTNPNLIITDYTKIGEVQDALAKKTCPGNNFQFKEDAFEYPVIKSGNNFYTLKEWLDAKIDTLEWALSLAEYTCRGETRTMEAALAKCPSKMLQVVGPGRVKHF